MLKKAGESSTILYRISTDGLRVRAVAMTEQLSNKGLFRYIRGLQLCFLQLKATPVNIIQLHNAQCCSKYLVEHKKRFFATIITKHKRKKAQTG